MASARFPPPLYGVTVSKNALPRPVSWVPCHATPSPTHRGISARDPCNGCILAGTAPQANAQMGMCFCHFTPRPAALPQLQPDPCRATCALAVFWSRPERPAALDPLSSPRPADDPPSGSGPPSATPVALHASRRHAATRIVRATPQCRRAERA